MDQGTPGEVREGLAANLRTIQGLRVSEYLPEQINAPMAVINLERLEYLGAFQGGLRTYSFIVMLIAGRMGERSAQRQLDAFMAWDGDQSVRQAVEADTSLGGAAQTCKVEAARGVRMLDFGDATYLVVDFEIEVMA